MNDCLSNVIGTFTEYIMQMIAQFSPKPFITGIIVPDT